ncbi:MAG: PEP-CTERM sorting domain-containing protein [Woeseia sp.]
MKTKLFITLSGLVMAFAGNVSQATPITCGNSARTATLDSAESCVTSADTGSTRNNPNASDIGAAFPLEPWTALGDIPVNITSGRFGANSVDLDWNLDSDIWSEWGELVVSIHVGRGQSNLSWFAWLITPFNTSGTLSYDRLSGGGGGFSNIKLWGRGEPTMSQVPEPASLFLLGLGLAGIGVARRKKGV